MFTIAINGSYPRHPDPPRPSILRQADAARAAGTLSDKDWERAQRRAIIEVVAEMIAAGVEVVSDGQLRWQNSTGYICRMLKGFDVSNPLAPTATGRVDWVRPILEDDYRFLAERSPVEIRPALTGPFTLSKLCERGWYQDDYHFQQDLAAALHRELEGLEAAGVQHLLVEEPLLVEHKGEIDAFARAAEVLCEGLEMRLMLGTSGGDLVGLEEYLKNMPFGGVALDMVGGPDNELLFAEDDIWNGQVIQLGVVDAVNGRVEEPEGIAEKLVRYAAFYDPELLWVAPTAGMGRLTRTVAFDKLNNLHQGVVLARREVARQEQPGGSRGAVKG